MHWYSIEHFNYYIGDHIKLLDLLSISCTYTLFRKDYVDFNDIDVEIQKETIEDTFESYLEKGLYINEELEEKIQNSIISNVGHVLFPKTIDFIDSLNRAIEVVSIEDLWKIKKTMTEIIYDHSLTNDFPAESLAFKKIKDLSLRFSDDPGIKPNYFDWYDFSERQKRNETLKKTFSYYNIILTNDLNVFENFTYFVEFYEDSILNLCFNLNENTDKIIKLIKDEFNCSIVKK